MLNNEQADCCGLPKAKRFAKIVNVPDDTERASRPPEVITRNVFSTESFVDTLSGHRRRRLQVSCRKPRIAHQFLEGADRRPACRHAGRSIDRTAYRRQPMGDRDHGARAVHASAIASVTSRSVWLSSAAVASSKNSTGGS